MGSDKFLISNSCSTLQLLLITFSLFFLSTSFSIYPKKKIYSTFNSVGIVIDGNLNDWENKNQIVLKNKVSDNSVAVLSQWNKDSLYLSFQVKDKNLQAYQKEQDHHLLYLDDMVEVLFDPSNHKDSCWNSDDIVYHINILGVKKDDCGTFECKTNPGWNGNANFMVKLQGSMNLDNDEDIGYVVEFAIAWDELGLSPKKGLKIGINFANGDNDGNGRQLFDWVGAWPMRSPFQFGELQLK